MPDSIRKVCRLRISSQDESAILSDVNTLREALSIASLPGLPPHGITLVKKLDLGKYQSRSTVFSVSQLIDEHVRSLSYQSTCVDEQEYPQQNVVWFSDLTQAVMRLTSLVAQNKTPRAWYWSKLFPSLQSGMNLAEVLVTVCKDYSEQKSKLFVFARVIDQLLSQGKINTIFEAVTTRLSQLLLTEAGLYPYLASKVSRRETKVLEQPPHIQAHWQALVRKSINEWGEQDARTIWLTFNALILQYPVLAESKQMLPKLTALIENNKFDNRLLANNKFNDIKNPETQVQQIKRSKNTAYEEDISVMNDAKQPKSVQSTNDSSHSNKNIAHKADDSVLNDAKQTASNQSTNDLPITKIGIDPYLHRTDDSSHILIGEHEEITQTPIAYAGLVNSDYCGLAFLISLLELISIRDVLSLNASLAALNLPPRIISTIARRLGISNNHPVLQAMPELAVANKQSIKHFISPAGWESLILSPLPNNKNKSLHRFKIKGDHSKSYITDRTNKILLYIGNSKPSNLPVWLKSYSILDQPNSYECPTLDNLETTIQLLIIRYLHRYAKISLRQIINRNGEISLTKTHLDILFDMKQIDIRIRLGGLDINPGWVPWLAMVVQFHYDSGD